MIVALALRQADHIADRMKKNGQARASSRCCRPALAPFPK